MDELLAYFLDASHWQWLALAMLLFGLEVIMPGFLLLWFAIAAVVVGSIVFLFPEMGAAWQVVIFIVLAIAIAFLGRKYFAPNGTTTDHPNLNQRGKELIGRKITLDADINDGVGRMSVGDSTWEARTEDGTSILKGTKVEIVAVDGATLVVKAS